MADTTDVLDNLLEFDGSVGLTQPDALAPFAASIFAVTWPMPEGWVQIPHKLVTSRFSVGLYSHGPDWADKDTDFEVTIGGIHLEKTPKDNGKGTFRSETRTCVSFWVGSADIMEDAQAALAPVPYIYAGGFHKSGFTVCSKFVTENGVISTTGQDLVIAKSFTTLGSPDADETTQNAMRPGVVALASQKIRWSIAADGAAATVKFACAVNSDKPSFSLTRPVAPAKPLCEVQAWMADGGVNLLTTDHAVLVLQSVPDAAPVVGDGFAGELRFKHVPGGVSHLFLSLADGTWNSFIVS